MEITFGAVPETDDDQTRLMLADFCDVLSRRTGVRVRPHRSPSPGALAAAFGRGRVQLAWVSPTLFLLSEAFEAANPLVSTVRSGRTRFHGVLFVRSDSAIRTISQLRGRSVGWVAESSAAGYLMPRVALANRGVDIDGLLGGQTFLQTHGAVVESVLAGRCDVGATFAVFEGGDNRRPLVRAGFEPTHARVLLASEPIPADLVVASPSIPAALLQKVREGLCQRTTDDRFWELCQALFGAEDYADFDPAPLHGLKDDLFLAQQRGEWNATG